MTNNHYVNAVSGATANSLILSPDAVDDAFARAANAALENAVELSRELIGAHQAAAAIIVESDWSTARKYFSLSEKYAAWARYDTPAKGFGSHNWFLRQGTVVRMTQAELEAHPAWKGFGYEAGKHPPMRGWLAAPIVDRDGKCWGLLQLSDRIEGDSTRRTKPPSSASPRSCCKRSNPFGTCATSESAEQRRSEGPERPRALALDGRPDADRPRSARSSLRGSCGRWPCDPAEQRAEHALNRARGERSVDLVLEIGRSLHEATPVVAGRSSNDIDPLDDSAVVSLDLSAERDAVEIGFEETKVSAAATKTLVSRRILVPFGIDVLPWATSRIDGGATRRVYAPAQIVRDALEHGVEVRPVCVNASRWDCTLEPRGDAALASIEDAWRRADVQVASLVRIAEADGLAYRCLSVIAAGAV